MSDAPIGELAFLRKLQRLLAEGDFVATDKFALLNALADLSLEREPDEDGSLRVPVSASPRSSSSTTGRRRARIARRAARASCCCRTPAGKPR